MTCENVRDSEMCRKVTRRFACVGKPTTMGSSSEAERRIYQQFRSTLRSYCHLIMYYILEVSVDSCVLCLFEDLEESRIDYIRQMVSKTIYAIGTLEFYPFIHSAQHRVCFTVCRCRLLCPVLSFGISQQQTPPHYIYF